MPKTVKVRVPVVVYPDGKQTAGGYIEDVQAEILWTLTMAGRVHQMLANQWNPTARVYYLTAELPIPDSDEVAAEVEEG